MKAPVTVLVAVMDAGDRTVVAADAWQLPEQPAFEAATVAWLSNGPARFGAFSVRVSVSLVPAAMLAMFHAPVAGVKVPAEAMNDAACNDGCAGKLSVTATSNAVSAPVLFTVTV